MVLFVVDAFEIVWAQFAFFCFESKRIRFEISFVVLGQISVVFKLVGASTFLAFGTVDTICKGGITPLPAVVALEDARVHRGASDGSNVSSKVEGPIDNGLGFGAVL